MFDPHWPRRCWFIASALLAVSLAMPPLALSFAAHPDPLIYVDALLDDAYYYLEIAARLADTGRSTLDGISLTNGYHPLWLLALTGLAALGTQTWEFFVRSFWLIAVVALVGPATAWLWRRTASAGTAFIAGAALAVTLLEYQVVFLAGMEPILFSPLFVSLVVLLEAPVSGGSLLGLSALLALAFLARLDGLVLFGSVLMVLSAVRLSQSGRRAGNGHFPLMATVLRLGSVLVPTLLAYLALNQWLFHCPVPISGLSKGLDGPKFANWWLLRQFLGEPAAQLYLLVIIVVWVALELLARMAGQRSPTFLRSMAVFALAAVTLALYYASFSTWPIWQWYAYLTALTAATILARIILLCNLMLAHDRVRSLAACALVVLLVFGTMRAYGHAAGMWKGTPSAPSDSGLTANQLSIEMLSDFFADKVPLQVAMGDRAGGLVYWGGGKGVSVVQSEGLTLDAEYLKARRLNLSESYFASRFDIRYWIADREVIPLVTREDGSREYVVADPVQGRVSVYPVTTFCFPEAALIYRKNYGQDLQPSTRFVFSFAQRQPCSANSLHAMQTVRQSAGLRQLSLPHDYEIQTPDGMQPNSRKRHEDSDRARALRRADPARLLSR